MNVKTSVEKLAEDIGFDISNSDDITQSNLLNGLGKGFKYLSDQQFQMQLCYIVEKLNPDTDKFIVELAKFIELKIKKS